MDVEGDEIDLALAFPARLRDAVASAAPLLGGARLAPAGVVAAAVEGEPVSIPYRIYFDAPGERDLDGLSPTVRLVVDCLFTRHHDGHARERHGIRVASSTDPAVAPFVLQLFAEYVLEIAVAVGERIPRTADALAMYTEFCAANSPFITLARARATSYWGCYYRTRFLDRGEYPPLALLDELCPPISAM